MNENEENEDLTVSLGLHRVVSLALDEPIRLPSGGWSRTLMLRGRISIQFLPLFAATRDALLLPHEREAEIPPAVTAGGKVEPW